MDKSVNTCNPLQRSRERHESARATYLRQIELARRTQSAVLLVRRTERAIRRK